MTDLALNCGALFLGLIALFSTFSQAIVRIVEHNTTSDIKSERDNIAQRRSEVMIPSATEMTCLYGMMRLRSEDSQSESRQIAQNEVSRQPMNTCTYT